MFCLFILGRTLVSKCCSKFGSSECFTTRYLFSRANSEFYLSILIFVPFNEWKFHIFFNKILLQMIFFQDYEIFMRTMLKILNVNHNLKRGNLGFNGKSLLQQLAWAKEAIEKCIHLQSCTDESIRKFLGFAYSHRCTQVTLIEFHVGGEKLFRWSAVKTFKDFPSNYLTSRGDLRLQPSVDIRISQRKKHRESKKSKWSQCWITERIRQYVFVTKSTELW